MGHSRFEITEAGVQFETRRLGALIDEARERGYLEDLHSEESPANDSANVAALDALLGEFFPIYYDLSLDDLNHHLVFSSPEIEWYDGAGFATDDLVAILAIAAMPGSSIVFLDFEDYTRDIYEIVFDGDGTYRRVNHVTNGVPVRHAG